jgi:diguanylate cyclase (GGDEF)-like protein/PAS domain S-box-containing protein
MPLYRTRVSRFAPAIFATALGLVVTTMLFAGVRKIERNHAADEFRVQASVRIASVKEGLVHTVEALTTLNHFFGAIGNVDREQFHTFATALLQSNPQIRSFSLQRLLTPKQRPAYEAAMRERYPGFSIGSWVDGKRSVVGPLPNYRVVDYLEPMQGNEVAFGLEASTIPKQFDAMQRARDSGLPSASEMLVLIQDPETQRSFIVLMAVYRRGAALHDVGSRRRAVVGFTSASIRTKTLVENALRDKLLLSDPTVTLSLYSGDSDDESTLAFRTGSGRAIQGGNVPWWGRLYNHAPHRLSQTFSVAGKSWHVTVSGQSTGLAFRHGGSLMILIAGLGATLAGAAYLHARGLRSSRHRKLGRRDGARLRAAHDLLRRDVGLRKQEEQARTLGARAHRAGEYAVLITNARGPDHLIEQVDAAFERMTGYLSAEAVGRNGNFLWGDDHDQPSIDEIRALVDRTLPACITLRMYRRDGTLFLCRMHIVPVEAAYGDAAHFVAAMYDLTAQAEFRKELEFQANRDAVTGLANRHLLLDRLMQAIAHANRNAEQLWLIVIDFDWIDPAGAVGGAQAGETLIVRAAERLQSLVRLTDTVARLAGGEFVLVLAARSDERMSPQVIRRLLDAVKQPLTSAERLFLPDCSVGIAIYPEDGEDSETLIMNACNAMHDSSRTGDDLRFYSPKPPHVRYRPT